VLFRFEDRDGRREEWTDEEEWLGEKKIATQRGRLLVRITTTRPIPQMAEEA